MSPINRIAEQYVQSCLDYTKLKQWIEKSALIQNECPQNSSCANNAILSTAMAHWVDQYTYCSIIKSTTEYILSYLPPSESYIIYEHYINGRALKELVSSQSAGNDSIYSHRTL